MAECFCGCESSIKALGHQARANRLGRKLTSAVPLAKAAAERVPEFRDDREIQQLAHDGPGRLAEVKAYVHGERTRDQIDADGINAWYSTWNIRRAQLVKNGTDGWIGMNPFKTLPLLLLGERAVATITNVGETGMTVNDDPRVHLTFLVQPKHGQPFQVQRKLIVSRLAIPQRGTRVEIAYDASDPEQFTFRRDALEPGAVQPSPQTYEADDLAPAGLPSLTKAGPPTDSADPADPVGRLTTLAALHATGALTDEEFVAAKAQALGLS